ncbi:MAG: hypothetical protein LJE95_01045 [Acidobacteria bacterium]|jgi:uridine phosphorylase|nr:hypothetical protein [Acidobacteriota bacterium]
MSQRRFGHSNNPDLPASEAVLLLPFGRQSYLPAIADRYDGEEVALDETTDRIVYILRGAPRAVTLIYSGMGGPAAANAVEMAAANGARRLVVVGACGGVSPDVAVGDLVAPFGAVRGEGTSAYYAPSAFPAAFDPELVSRLLGSARARDGVSVHKGIVYTTDASYRQGGEIYEDHRGLVIAAECECATVAVVGARLGIASAALLFCTDNVTLRSEGDRVYSGLADPRVERAFTACLDAALEALR